jgi:hypothetical protein
MTNHNYKIRANQMYTTKLFKSKLFIWTSYMSLLVSLINFFNNIKYKYLRVNILMPSFLNYIFKF